MNPSHALRAGLEQQQAGRLREAEALYRQALQIAPEHPDALHLLGLVELQSGRHQAALEWLRRAIAVQPAFADAHANLGYVLTLQQQLDPAVASLRQALALKPDHKLAHNNLGNALLGLGRTDEAIAAYRQALRIDPRYVEAHFNLASALRDWGALDAAAASLHTALELKADFVEAHYTLGLVYWESGRLQEAAARLKRALELRPNHAEAHFHLHCVLLDLEGPEAALRCLERALALKPQDPGFRFFFAMLLEHRGDAAAAAAHLSALARGSPLDRARLAGWQYIKSLGGAPPRPVGSPLRAFQIGMEAARAAGLVLEFGVRLGSSIRQIAALAAQPVHGFDSFAGIPEEWHGERRGSYSTNGVLPEVPDNVALHAGWFDETLPRFLSLHEGPVRFANIDCDLYSSTRTVLSLLADRIVPGTVLVFDEFLGYEHWQEDEQRAFAEAVSASGWRYECLGFSFATKQAVIRITG
jgi:tetratricopeptide (TPR) repeat protein